MDYTKQISNSLSKVASLPAGDIKLEKPENEEFGDYSSNVALTLFGKSEQNKAFKSPRDLAQDLADKLNKDKKLKDIVIKIDVAGPGFINFSLRKEILFDTLLNVLSYKDTFRYTSKNKHKKVIVEYSSPNIAKPFTIGHLRSTIIGDAIANLLEATGWEVFRDNHLGDWGTQFGKQIYAIKAWGDVKKIESSDNPVKELVNLYVKFHEEAEKDPAIEEEARKWFKKLEDGDKEARDLWQKCVNWSWKEFSKIYNKLGVSFSKEFNDGKGLGEAFFEDKMKPVVKELNNKKLLKEGKEGAKLVFFENDKYPPAMIIKKDGATLYHTRDLATDKYRSERYKPDLIINEVGVEQSLYFQQLYEIELLLGWYAKDQRKHIAHGLYRFNDRKMSTRKGDVVWLEDIIEEAIKQAKALGSNTEEVARQVAVGALKYNDLKRDAKGDITFNWQEILNMEGNSGPYLQYTHARTQAVLSKSEVKSPKLSRVDSSDLKKEELSLLRTFIYFPEVVEEAAGKYSPNILCEHLYDLAQKYNSFYNAHKIVGGDNEEFRVLLTQATGAVLKTGLNLLGIQTPERM